MARMLNPEKGTVVAERVDFARSMWSRFRGLMLRSGLPEGEGLYIERSGSIHTAFMRFPIDVVFLDREQLVLKVVHSIRPWRLSFSRAYAALELPPGTAELARVEKGDRLLVEEGLGTAQDQN